MEERKSIRKGSEKRKEKGRALSFIAASIRYFARGARQVAQAFWQICLKEEEQKKGKGILLGVLFFTGIFGLSAVVSLARFPLDIYPAGFAYLAALGGWKQRGVSPSQCDAKLETAMMLTAFSGVLLSAAFLPKYGFFYLLAYTICFLARAGLTGGKMNESLLARVTFSASCSVGLGLFVAFREGFLLKSVFGAVSMGILTPLLTYLLCGFYVYVGEGVLGEKIRSQKRVYLEGAFFTLSYLFLYALREVEMGNISLSFVLAVLFTLSLSRTRGALYGAAGGLIGGMALLSPASAPALAVAGFFAGLFFSYSAYVAMMISFVAACGYCMYTEGLENFGHFTADYLVALVLFFPLLRVFPKEKDLAPQKGAARDVMHKETVRCARQRLKNMSEAFSSLSQVFYTVSDTMKKPRLPEISRLVSDCCAEHCSRCTLSAFCWGEEQSAAVESTSRAATCLLTRGSVSKEDFDEPFRSKCISLPTLVSLINRRFEEINGSFLKNNKTRLLAGEYSSVSRLLQNTAGELDRELKYNPDLEVRARKALKELGILYRRVAVFGDREMKIDVYGVALEKVDLCADRILEVFGKEFGCVFDAPSFLMLEESVVMRLCRKRILFLECAKSGCTKKGEAISGDNASFFETEQDYFYTLICDGMGSGREAAFTSRLASIFIEKLMQCATPKNVTLEMLNTFLMSKTDETFTTVDLLEIDLLSAQANFIKAGAAPSYVLRGDRLHRVESRTPPAGILTRMCAEQTSFRLREGDFVILLSDGVESGGEGGWLIPSLAGRKFESASDLCEFIFSTAKEKSEISDDLSVSVIRIMNSK